MLKRMIAAEGILNFFGPETRGGRGIPALAEISIEKSLFISDLFIVYEVLKLPDFPPPYRGCFSGYCGDDQAVFIKTMDLTPILPSYLDLSCSEIIRFDPQCPIGKTMQDMCFQSLTSLL